MDIWTWLGLMVLVPWWFFCRWAARILGLRAVILICQKALAEMREPQK